MSGLCFFYTECSNAYFFPCGAFFKFSFEPYTPSNIEAETRLTITDGRSDDMFFSFHPSVF